MFVVWLPRLNSPELTERLQCAVGYVQCTGYGTTLPALVSIIMFTSI